MLTVSNLTVIQKRIKLFIVLKNRLELKYVEAEQKVVLQKDHLEMIERSMRAQEDVFKLELSREKLHAEQRLNDIKNHFE